MTGGFTLKTIRVRKATEGGNCGVCNQPVILHMEGEEWLLECACGLTAVPQWVIVDAYSKRQYLRRFEFRSVETEG